MKADLHIHSFYSDGKKSPKELVEKAKNAGLTHIALTDHDTIEGVEEIIALSEDLVVIPGLELSTVHNDESIHVLAYFGSVKKISDELAGYLISRKQAREDRMIKMIHLLKKHFDFDIDYDELKKTTKNVIARPHLAQAIAAKYGISRRFAFDKYIGEDSIAYVPSTKIDTKQGIELIHRSGGKAVLAHPYYIKNSEIIEFVKMGIDGIEAYYGEHSEDDRLKYARIARENNLFITGGSDFHMDNDFKHTDMMGTGNISGKDVERFLERINYDYNSIK